jgi:hypothetical protein
MLIISHEGPCNYTPSGELCHAVLRCGNGEVRIPRAYIPADRAPLWNLSVTRYAHSMRELSALGKDIAAE